MGKALTGYHPPSLWSMIKIAYEGRDPERQDSPAIGVEVLARAYGVHPNSIYNRASQRCWRRPDWYKQQGGPRRPPLSNAEQRRARMLQFCRIAASRQLPCPSQGALAAEAGLTGRQARNVLKELAAAGRFAIEYRGTHSRRLVFPDGSATGWTATNADRPRKPFARRARPAASPVAKAATVHHRTGVDLVVRDAAIALQRCGRQVFDTGIHHGRWRERWSVDGKLVDRAGLLQEARAA